MSKNSLAKYYENNKERKKARERYQSLSIEKTEKKVTIWSWEVQKSTGRWKTKGCWVSKKYYKMRQNTLL